VGWQDIPPSFTGYPSSPFSPPNEPGSAYSRSSKGLRLFFFPFFFFPVNALSQDNNGGFPPIKMCFLAYWPFPLIFLPFLSLLCDCCITIAMETTLPPFPFPFRLLHRGVRLQQSKIPSLCGLGLYPHSPYKVGTMEKMELFFLFPPPSSSPTQSAQDPWVCTFRAFFFFPPPPFVEDFMEGILSKGQNLVYGKEHRVLLPPLASQESKT